MRLLKLITLWQIAQLMASRKAIVQCGNNMAMDGHVHILGFRIRRGRGNESGAYQGGLRLPED